MENTFLAYLPTTYSLPDPSNGPEVYKQVPFRSKLLKALQECIEEAFDPV